MPCLISGGYTAEPLTIMGILTSNKRGHCKVRSPTLPFNGSGRPKHPRLPHTSLGWQAFFAQVSVLSSSETLQANYAQRAELTEIPIGENPTLINDEDFKTRWQGHTLQALVEIKAKTQVLTTRWQGNRVQTLVETVAKTQALKT